jgi:glycosyltransferase involved in cell wall biosynthesis
MRISIFSDSFHPYISGVSIAILQQANALVERGHEVSIVRPRPSRKDKGGAVPDLHPDIRVFDTPITIPHRAFARLRLTFPTFFATWRKIRATEPDLIHVHTEFGTGWEGLALARIRGVPLVGTFHTFFAEPEYLQHFPVPNTRWTRNLLWRYSVGFYNRCQTVVTPSQAVYRSLEERGAKCKLVNVSNGIRTPVLRPEEEVRAWRRELGLEGPTFLYVGRVSQEKSLELVLKAFARVAEFSPEARLLVIGSGPQEEELRALAGTLPHGERIQLTGAIPNHELLSRNYHRLGDVFVTASTTENQPISLLEAMAYGLPLIGPRAKGIPELILDGENGALVEPKDEESLAAAMQRVLAEPGYRDHLAAGARRLAADHDLGRVAATLEGLYEEAVQSRAAPR